MLRFQYSSLIDAERELVWQFYERQDIFELLTPPWQPVKVIRREGGLNIGAITEFRLLLSVFPIRWIAEHIECQPNQLFVDIQVLGPMKSWLHRHQFTIENGQTRLTDTIEYELPGGWLAEFLLGWWVNSRLQEMFRYRHQVTQRECQGKDD
ncbi:cyclase/dehydrase [Stanieria sp. NIES-3757]|nr:cyclase/dehydrase [Stanieria sp. NIES-3757]